MKTILSLILILLPSIVQAEYVVEPQPFGVPGIPSSPTSPAQPRSGQRRASSDDRPPFLAGHNLTPTTYTLKKGSGTAGFYILGYGLSDDLMVATSPWVILFYNMPMVNLRYRLYRQSRFELTAEGMFFKTIPTADAQMLFVKNKQRYQQTSTFERITASYRFSDFYSIHYSLGFQYFWDHTVPFSFYPEGHQGRMVVSTSALGELRFSEHWGSFIELGVMGLNFGDEGPYPDYPTVNTNESPFLHYGYSLYYGNSSFLIRLGFSRSQGKTKYSQAVRTYVLGDIDRNIFHPECELQYFF